MFLTKKTPLKMASLVLVGFTLLTALLWSNIDQVSANTSDYTVRRIYGDNRYETSALISQEGYQTADKVFITNAMEFADALAGVPLAYQYDAPILLANGSKLRPSTEKEIKRLGAKEAIILGGENAVNPAIEQKLKSMGLKTRRIAGDTRFQTAELIAKELQALTKSDYAAVVDGFQYADAMSIAPIAAREGFPIFLSHSHKLTSKEALKNYNETMIIGGETAISKTVAKDLNNPARIAGANRYETNVRVLDYYEVQPETLYIATGLDFPDALTGSVLAAKNDSAVALVRREPTEQLQNYIKYQGINSFVLFGGEHVLSQSIEDGFKTLPKEKFNLDAMLLYDNLSESVVIHAEVLGADGVEFFDGTYYDADPTGETFTHPISEHGIYTVTAYMTDGNLNTFILTIGEEEFEKMGPFNPTYTINKEGEFYVINLSSPNVAKVVDPSGNVYDSNSLELSLHRNFDLDYRVFGAGTYEFTFESVWGEKEVVTVELTAEEAYDPQVGWGIHLDEERRSLVIDLGINPAYELVDPDGKLHRLSPDKEGYANFVYEVSEAGDYQFIVRNKIGKEKNITVEVEEDTINHFKAAVHSLWKSYDPYQDEVTISFFTENVFSITDPDGSTHNTSDHIILIHDYVVSTPGAYTFTIEGVLGERLEVPVEVTVEDFK